MDEFFGGRILSAILGSNIEWTVLISFLVFVLVAFLSPVVGYEPKRPLGISVSLFLLIAYMVVASLHYIYLWSGFYNQVGGNNNRSGRDEVSTSVAYFVFTVVKMVIFVTAMITFAAGVLSLRLRKPALKSESSAVKSEVQ